MGVWKKHETNNPATSALGRGDIDFSGSPAIMSQVRLDNGRVLVLHWTYRSCFLFLDNSNNKIRIDEFISPFSTGTWFVTIISIVFCSIALSLLIQYTTDKRDDPGLSVILTISAICQQNYEYFPHRLSVRMAMVFFGFHGLLLYNFYNASLVSVRLSEQPSSINDSLNELAKTSLDFATEPLPFFNYLLKVC